MFGLSTWEILIIVAVALIFVGPDQLPKVARQIGKGVRQVRGAMGKVDDEMRRAVREAAAEFDDDGNPVEPPPAPATAPAVPSTPAPNVELAKPGDAAKPAEGPAASPPQPHLARDWSAVGKISPPGRVASASPARPVAPPAVSPTEANKAPSAPPAEPAAPEAAPAKPSSDPVAPT